MMPYRANYPRSVAEVLDDAMTFKPAALRAVKDLRRAGAWRGTESERLMKIQDCALDLCAAYGLPPVAVRLGALGGDCYWPGQGVIVLGPNLSVLSFLHEFAHHRGYDERQACRWSINLFRRVFPRSYSRLVPRGHMLVRGDR